MSPLLFTSCFMFFAVVLLVGIIYSRVYWVIKALLIGSSLGFAIIFYFGYVDALGYPAPLTPPGVFRFVYGMVREPARDDKGAIYIWTLATEQDKPRAIELPYSTANRKLIGEAKKRVLAGEPVYMGMSRQSSQGQYSPNRSNGNAPYWTGGRTSTTAHGTRDLEFKPPPDIVPRKESQ